MAYQLTNASSVEDLINKIATFAATVGWTVRRNSLAAGLRTLTLQKSGDNINLFNVDTSNIYVRGAVGYDAALAGNAQPNQAVSQARANVGTGPFSNVFMFAGNTPAEHLHVVVEIASGVFRHITFGELAKIGAWTGGTFFDAMFWDTSNTTAPSSWSNANHHRIFDQGSDYGQTSRGGVRCDFDGNTNYFAPLGDKSSYTTPVASGGIGDGASTTYSENTDRISNFYNRSVNNLTGNTPLQPIQIRVERPDGYWSPIGEVPGIRFMNMERFNPADEFTIASDTWKVFPFARKAFVSSMQAYSANFAFAYLKVP